MNGKELMEIYEQLDERGKRHLEVIAVAELKHAREGLYTARGGVLAAQASNCLMEGQNEAITGRND